MNRLQFGNQGQQSEPRVSSHLPFEQATALATDRWLRAGNPAWLRDSSYEPKAWPSAFRRSRSSSANGELAAFHRAMIWEDVAFLVLGLNGLVALVIAFA